MSKPFILLPTLLLAIAPFFYAGAQNINTVAGDGGGNYSGDKGQAIAAELHWPKGVAFDSASNLYIADYLNNVVRKVTPFGIITTIAGTGFEEGTGSGNYTGDGGPATAAHLWAPSGICVSKKGFVYIADLANNRVRMVDTSGNITTVAGTGVSGYSGDGGPATAAQLANPAKVALDTIGDLYIVDVNNNCIRGVDTFGNIYTLVGNPTIPAGYSGDGGPATAAQLYNPADIAVDLTGNLYIADYVNNAIRYVDAATYTIITLAGAGSAGFRGDGGAATTAQLFNPHWRGAR